MNGMTTAEVFIKALEDLVNADRKVQRAHRMQQNRAIAQRYVQAFHGDGLESRVAPVLSARDSEPGQQQGEQMRRA